MYILYVNYMYIHVYCKLTVHSMYSVHVHVYLTLLDSFFLPSTSLINMYIYIYMYMKVESNAILYIQSKQCLILDIGHEQNLITRM